MRLRIAMAVGATLIAIGACRSVGSTPACGADQICVTGTVRHLSLEGGFWAIRGDDSVTYDPVDGVPAAFQREGTRVRLVARQRKDMGSIHMVGPIVEIITIEQLGPK